jgi:hypothetical protein
MGNPYQSPQSPIGSADSSMNQRRILGTVLGVVVVNVALTAINVARNWLELTLVHHFVGMTLWVALPLLAVILIWRRHTAGRWILVALFGLRGIGEVCILVYDLTWIDSSNYPSILLIPPFRRQAVNGLFYVASAGWLLFSSRVRGLFRKP